MTNQSRKPNLSLYENIQEIKKHQDFFQAGQKRNLSENQTKTFNKNQVRPSLLIYECGNPNKELSKLYFPSHSTTSKKQEFLKKIPIFSNFSKKDLQSISSSLKKLIFSKDQCVYHQGDPIDFVYFVKSGEFQMTHWRILKTQRLVAQASGVLNKLSQSKNIVKKQDLVFSIKSQYEVIGYDEIAQNLKKREFNVYCASRTGTLYSIPHSEFSVHVLKSESSDFLQSKKDYFTLRKSELFKTEKVLDNILTSNEVKSPSKAVEINKEAQIKKKLKCFSVSANQVMKFTAAPRPLNQLKLGAFSKNLINSALPSPRSSASPMESQKESPKMINKSFKALKRLPPPNFMIGLKDVNTCHGSKKFIRHVRHISQ